ncbi:MAG: hypothetical protein FWE98_06145 [Oscillospiraceae bacterium]|nr:hypothetical protein [Oscillospiraceae bacterium]
MYDSEIEVYGNVTQTDAAMIGARAYVNSKVTIEGTITIPAGGTYISVGAADKTQADYEATTSKAGYFTYTDGFCTVWVKDPSYVPPKTIFSTRYEATFLNWILFFLGFGFIWMWF